MQDRNGTRRPNESAAQIFGEDPTAKEDRIDTLFAATSETVKDYSTPFTIEIDETISEFRVKFGDVVLDNGGIRIRSRNQNYSSRQVDIDPKDELKYKPLKIKSHNVQEGIDHIGKFEAYLISWYSSDKDVLLLTTIRNYRNPNCVMFRIEFPTGLQRTQTKNYEIPCVEFPIFRNKSNRSLVFTYTHTNFAEPHNAFAKTSAPLLFYNEDLYTFMISPTMNFLTAWNCPGNKFDICMGLEGNLKELPENFMHECILYADRGIARTFEKWGDILLKYYQKKRQPPTADIILSYLGYWTDKGTYYYNNTGSFKNYEECLLAIKEQALRQGIPYRYLQLDSYFYPKDDGTILWEGDTKIFPNTLASLKESLQMPLICQNRWFSYHTVYKGSYKDFINEEHDKFDVSGNGISNPVKDQKQKTTWSLPLQLEMWMEIMAKARSWGCVCYEQDCLQTQWRFFDYLRENVYAGRIWLKQITDASAAQGMTIQYNRTYPSFYLETLEFGNITHARCVDDYNHEKPKRFYVPHFTQTSMLCWSVGIWPWKDAFFSTCDPAPNSVNKIKKIPPHYEPYSELELLMQVLSAGPVGNGDEVNKLNANLLLQACMEDGLLLKPERPAFPIDLMFLDHHNYYTCMTYSVVSDQRWWYLLQINLWGTEKNQQAVTIEQLGLKGKYIMYDYFDKLLVPIEKVTLLERKKLIKENESSYMILAPILTNGMAFVGLRDKIISAPGRVFTKVMIKDRALIVEGQYAPHQNFALIAYVPSKPQKVVVDNVETTKYTWGPNYKTFTIVLFSDDGKFSLQIE